MNGNCLIIHEQQSRECHINEMNKPVQKHSQHQLFRTSDANPLMYM